MECFTFRDLSPDEQRQAAENAESWSRLFVTKKTKEAKLQKGTKPTRKNKNGTSVKPQSIVGIEIDLTLPLGT